MKSINLKALMPHLLSIGLFLLVAVLFCLPALNPDLMMDQGDTTSWKGMSHQSMEYKEKHGQMPLWAPNMFSGMPAYQIAMDGPWNPLSVIDKTLQLGLPQPINYFFLACICFYFLGICLGLRSLPAAIGALAFAYSTYSPIIISAGHNTKMLALAYSPAVIGAAIIIFNRKYLQGFALLALFSALQIGQNHQQITYYLFFILLGLTIYQLVKAFKQKEIGHFFKSAALMALAGVIGVSVSAITLLPVYDFSKESKRGGQLVLNDQSNNKDNIKGNKTTGLSKDYAFQWSYGKNETWTMLIPGALGYGLHFAETDGETFLFPKLDENSRTAEAVTTLGSSDLANQLFNNFQQRLYWGTQPFTNGPVYLGAIICLLFVLALFMLETPHKWWILAVSALSIPLAWGNNFPAFNYWVFDHIPLYNKFRAPTMILIIPQILVPLLGAMLLDKIFSRPEEKDWKLFRKGLLAMAGIFVLALSFYFNSEFSNENKKRTREFNTLLETKAPDISATLASKGSSYEPSRDNDLYESIATYFSNAGIQQPAATARELMDALKEDRKSIFFKDLSRSFILILLASLLIGLAIRRMIKPAYMLVGIVALTGYDLLDVGSKYINKYNFDSKSNFEDQEFPLTATDREILNDTDPNFRVLNTRGIDESKTSYYHKSIGGYHPAKLGIYDDLLAYQLNGRLNMSVINMLNTKYFIQQNEAGQTVALRNPEALGNCWFVKGVRWVNGPAEEMTSLNNFNPADTAVIDNNFREIAASASMAADSSDKITMKVFDNDSIQYVSETRNSRIAVFSEIFYKDWNAYVDGVKVPIMKVNYVLRGMVVPAGKHVISFRFEPSMYFLGRTISLYSSWVVIILLALFVVIYQKKRKTSKE